MIFRHESIGLYQHMKVFGFSFLVAVITDFDGGAIDPKSCGNVGIFLTSRMQL